MANAAKALAARLATANDARIRMVNLATDETSETAIEARKLGPVATTYAKLGFAGYGH